MGLVNGEQKQPKKNLVNQIERDIYSQDTTRVVSTRKENPSSQKI